MRSQTFINTKWWSDIHRLYLLTVITLVTYYVTITISNHKALFRTQNSSVTFKDKACVFVCLYMYVVVFCACVEVYARAGAYTLVNHTRQLIN